MRRKGGVLDSVVGGYRRLGTAADRHLAAAAVLGLAALVEVAVRIEAAGRPTIGDSSSSFALMLALATTLPIALVRLQPVAAAMLVVAAVAVTLPVAGVPSVAGLVALGAVLYAVGRHRSRQVAATFVVPFLAYAVAPFARDLPGSRTLAVLLLAGVAGAALAGATQRSRLETEQRDASVRAMTDTLTEHVARGERARIARELHDVVAHHISMIAVQAEAARLTTPGLPAEGAKRLVAIGDTARSALTEMRRLLGVLREDAGAEPTRRPQPGLWQLNELLDEARRVTRVSTRLIVSGQVCPLDPGIELTAYRIVQEALTNARRHAPGSAVDVELHYRDDALRVLVRDNGPGRQAGAEASGHGLTGMSERAAMVGGRLSAGPGTFGGFLVEAVLPAAAAATALPS